jgi:hypothetical protein
MDIRGLKCGWSVGGLREHRAEEKGEKSQTSEGSHRHLDLYRSSSLSKLRLPQALGYLRPPLAAQLESVSIQRELAKLADGGNYDVSPCAP